MHDIRLNRILVLYKHSAYESYFKILQPLIRGQELPILENELKYLQQAHQQHYATLKHIFKTLKSFKLLYKKYYRGEKINYNAFDFVITIGGDGTFLEAAHHVKNQLLLGVNSSPQFSVGSYCLANPTTFPSVLKKILEEKVKIRQLQQLNLKVSAGKKTFNVLNDILICHLNPAVMSRYYLKINNIQERQRSSGLWISTATGSTGAIRSADGQPMLKDDFRIQYRPRELYPFKNHQYKLRGGILSLKSKVSIISLMPQGRIYVDGDHISVPFPYGTEAVVTHSLKTVKTVTLL